MVGAKEKRVLTKAVKRLVEACGVTFTLNAHGHVKATSEAPKTKSCRKAMANANRAQSAVIRSRKRHRR